MVAVKVIRHAGVDSRSCMPDKAHEGWNIALKWQLEVKSHLFVCLIVHNNHPTKMMALPIERLVIHWLIVCNCFSWNHKCFTWVGYKSSQSSSMSTPHWWAPVWANSSIWLFFCLLDAWGGDHWVTPIGLNLVPLAMNQFYKAVRLACKPVITAICWLGIDHCVVFIVYKDAQVLHHPFSFLLHYTYTGLDQKSQLDNLEWQGHGSKYCQTLQWSLETYKGFR